jgi:hypothetical protein
MDTFTFLLILALVWGVSVLLSAWLAARKARSPKRWALLGVLTGPLSLVIHVFYPPRYVPDAAPCPGCGKAVSRRAVACHHCQYRFPAVDVLITRMPEDPTARRTITDEVAREYGITYEEATRKVAALPVAGYRHLAPDQADDFVRRLTQVGAETSVVPAVESSGAR